MCDSGKATTSASDPAGTKHAPSAPARHVLPHVGPHVVPHVLPPAEPHGELTCSSNESAGARTCASPPCGARRGFRTWRGERPFWAGLFTLAAGFPILYFPYAHLNFGAIPLALSTSAGAGSLIIGVLLVVLALSLWFQQQTRVFAGITVILLALVSFPVANFGASSSGWSPV